MAKVAPHMIKKRSFDMPASKIIQKPMATLIFQHHLKGTFGYVGKGNEGGVLPEAKR